MDCEKCQNLLSDFLDGALRGREHALVRAHLDACAACAGAREEFHAIVSAARSSREHLYSPPNEHALWLRIRNTIESESNSGRAAARAASGESFWARLLGKRWEFTLPQLATGVAALAVAVALVTTLGVQYTMDTRQDAGLSVAERSPRPAFAEAGYPNGYLRPHQASLSYWQQRVEQRKASWNPRMRDSFDRSLLVLDQTVNESLSDLRQNPHDEVAEEMLNSALRDKIELLREFGEQ